MADRDLRADLRRGCPTRPANERPHLLLVVGYPAEGAVVPMAPGRKKPLSEIATFM